MTKNLFLIFLYDDEELKNMYIYYIYKKDIILEKFKQQVLKE